MRRAAPAYLTEDAATRRARQGGVRRTLRALPLEQACRRCRRASTSRTATARTTSAAGTRYWAWTKTDEFKNQMRPIVLADDFLDGQLPLDRAARAVTLMQTNICSPIATNAIAGNIWDNFSSAVLQGAAVGRHDQGPEPAHRRGVRLHAARRRPRLHAAGLARQRLVHGAVPAEQHRRPVRPEPVGRGADARVPGVDRADALAGAPARRIRSSPTRTARASADRSHDRRQLHLGAAGLHPRRPAQAARRSASGCFRSSSANGEVQIGPIPEGHAGQPAREHRSARRRPAAGRAARST